MHPRQVVGTSLTGPVYKKAFNFATSNTMNSENSVSPERNIDNVR